MFDQCVCALNDQHCIHKNDLQPVTIKHEVERLPMITKRGVEYEIASNQLNLPLVVLYSTDEYLLRSFDKSRE